MNVSSPVAAFCGSCGTKVSNNASKFCSSCGDPLTSPAERQVSPPPSPGLPKENIVSVFRKPTSDAHAAKKRAWAFSSGAVFAGLGVINLLVAAMFDLPTNAFIGVVALLVAVCVLGQGLLLLGYTED